MSRCFMCEFDPRDPRNQWAIIVVLVVLGAILEVTILRMLGL